MKVSAHFEKRDLWFGAYWDLKDGILYVYVCLIPTLPIKFEWGLSAHRSDWWIGPFWDLRDLWFGVYWNLKDGILYVYVCLIPTLPIKFEWDLSAHE